MCAALTGLEPGSGSTTAWSPACWTGQRSCAAAGKRREPRAAARHSVCPPPPHSSSARLYTCIYNYSKYPRPRYASAPRADSWSIFRRAYKWNTTEGQRGGVCCGLSPTGASTSTPCLVRGPFEHKPRCCLHSRTLLHPLLLTHTAEDVCTRKNITKNMVLSVPCSTFPQLIP